MRGAPILFPSRFSLARMYFANLSPLVIPIQLASCSGGNILDGMVDSFWNKDFVARFCDHLLLTEGQLELPHHDSHKLVRRMDEIIPLSARRVGEYITGVAPPAPVLSDLVTVERRLEFLAGEVGHGAL
jgi:hypothetical protein